MADVTPQTAGPEDAAFDDAPAAPAPADADAPPPLRWRRYWLIGVLSLLPLSLLAFVADDTLHEGQVVRGVTMAQVRLGGLSRSGVLGALRKVDSRLAARPIEVTVREQSFVLRPEKVALSLDIDALADEALAAGRQGGLFSRWLHWLRRLATAHSLPLHAKLDAAALRAEIALWQRTAIADPAFEGAIKVVAGTPQVVAPRAGWAIDVEPTRLALTQRYVQPEPRPLVLPLARSEPRMQASTIDRALSEARALISGDVHLLATLPPPSADALAKRRPGYRLPPELKAPPEPTSQRFVFAAALLGRALSSRVTDEGRKIALFFDAEVIDEGLTPARKVLEHPPLSARFEVTDKDEVLILPGRSAAKLNAEAVAQALLAAAQDATRQQPFPIEKGDPPQLTSEDARRLNIAGKVSEFTTRHACCKPRVTNIHLIADAIDGVVVRPGEVFSINEHVGQRTVAKGYKGAPTIVHGAMKDTIGGGISQFATTFFNAAFYGGYNIIERQPHSYYFRRYPRGIEATLSYPKPDVIIRNDTASGLLIKTYYTPTSITVKMFGDGGGRKVSRKVTRALEPTKPPTEYLADRRLHPDQRKTKVSGAAGWSMYVTRIIDYPDGTQKKQTRKVTYQPRPRLVRVHPCKIPKGKDGYTGEPCPRARDDD